VRRGAVELNGDRTYRVTDRFSPSITDAPYGLGQYQSGMFNYRGATVELGQNNTDVALQHGRDHRFDPDQVHQF